MNSIEKLLSISGEPLGRQPAVMDLVEFGECGQFKEQLMAVLCQRNGFYAFESALHVFPAATCEKEMTLSRWNSFGLWRHEYGSLAEKMFFFAEDAFGDQFCFFKGQVCSFDAETGETRAFGRSLEQWAHSILKEYEVLTAYPLLHQWELQHGALPVGTRLMPKIPFVLGGAFSLENLYPIGAVSGMKTRGYLAMQLKDLPEGAHVEFRVIE